MKNLLPIINSDELSIISDLTRDLTKLRQNECKHLSIENFSTELFARLLEAYIETVKKPPETGEETEGLGD